MYAQEKESEADDIMNLLKSLESDKIIEKKFKEPDKKPVKQPKKFKESPLAILSKVSTTMENVVKEMNDKKGDSEKIVKDQKEIVTLLDKLFHLP